MKKEKVWVVHIKEDYGIDSGMFELDECSVDSFTGGLDKILVNRFFGLSIFTQDQTKIEQYKKDLIAEKLKDVLVSIKLKNEEIKKLKDIKNWYQSMIKA